MSKEHKKVGKECRKSMSVIAEKRDKEKWGGKTTMTSGQSVVKHNNCEQIQITLTSLQIHLRNRHIIHASFITSPG